MCGNTSMQIRDAIIICQNVYLVHLSETISMKTWTPQVFCLFIMFALICQNFRKWKLFLKRRDELSKYKRVQEIACRVHSYCYKRKELKISQAKQALLGKRDTLLSFKRQIIYCSAE